MIQPLARCCARSPGAIYTEPDIGPQIILIPDGLDGDYQIASTGYRTGPYLIQMDRIDETGILPIDAFVGEAAPGQIDTYNASYVPPGMFHPQVEYPIGKNPLSLATGDLNADGNADIVTGIFPVLVYCLARVMVHSSQWSAIPMARLPHLCR